MKTTRRALILGAGSLAAGLGTPAFAQNAAANWPKGPVRIIVPNVPGGALDILARLLEGELGKMWKQPIVVEFKPGAGTITGTDYVAKSPPDGQTLGILAIGVLGIQPALRKDMPFDTLKDLSGTMLVVGNIVMSATPKAPYNDLAGLIAYGKANKGKLSYATAGAFSSMPHIKAGKMKAVAIMGLKRDPSAPEIPAAGELFPEFDFASNLGIGLPRGTPPEIIAKINADVNKAIRSEALAPRLKEMGLQVTGSTPEQFDAHMRKSLKQFADIVKAANVTVN